MSFLRSTTRFSTTEIMAMNPPKLVQAIRKKIQKSDGKEMVCGTESETRRVSLIDEFPV